MSNSRRYEDLWKRIAASDKPLEVVCASSFARRLIQAVRKEKSIANVTRKNLDMPRYGKLLSVIEPSKTNPREVSVTFTLEFNGDKL